MIWLIFFCTAADKRNSFFFVSFDRYVKWNLATLPMVMTIVYKFNVFWLCCCNLLFVQKESVKFCHSLDQPKTFFCLFLTIYIQTTIQIARRNRPVKFSIFFLSSLISIYWIILYHKDDLLQPGTDLWFCFSFLFIKIFYSKQIRERKKTQQTNHKS